MHVVDLLARLVAMPTVSRDPLLGLAALLAELAEDQGFRVELQVDPAVPGKCNVLARLGPDDLPGEGLMLSGHMDVVPVDGQPWTSDPFSLTRKGDALYGRGTADMKGFLAAAVVALARVQPARLRRPVALLWTHDEEVGCLGSARFAGEARQRGLALPSECLIGEPTGFRVLRMHPGHVAVRLVAQGAAAHSSKPDLGASAIVAMGRVLADLERLEEELRQERRLEEHLERPWVTMNAGCIHGGTAVNLVPDRCELLLGYRPLPGDDPDAVLERIRERLARLPLPAGTQVEALRERVTPGLLTEAGTPLEALLAPHATPEPPGAASFATDGGNLASLGIRSLVFGPGSIDVAHKADEHVPLDHLHRAVEVLERVLVARCG